jgi:lysophospholipase L1-like esterase
VERKTEGIGEESEGWAFSERLEEIMNQKTIIIILVLGVSILTAIFFWPKKPEPLNLDPNLKIVFFGDSLVQGVGASEKKDLPSLLSQKTGVEFINAGISGNTTADGLARLEKDVLEKKPNLVLVLLGGNDALRQMPTEQTFSNLENIITQIKNSGAKVLLLGVRGGVAFVGKDYEPEFEKLAKKTNVVLVPDVLDGIFGHKDLMSDGIHPNDQGYEKIAEKILKYLPKAFK